MVKGYHNETAERLHLLYIATDAHAHKQDETPIQANNVEDQNNRDENLHNAQ